MGKAWDVPRWVCDAKLHMKSRLRAYMGAPGGRTRLGGWQAMYAGRTLGAGLSLVLFGRLAWEARCFGSTERASQARRLNRGAIGQGMVRSCPSPNPAPDMRPPMLFANPADAAFAATISNLV